MSLTAPLPSSGRPSARLATTPSNGVVSFSVAPMAIPPAHASLADRIDAALPQTQCTRCGYPDCRAYADALAAGTAELNQCPPGGAEGVQRLASLLGRPALPLAPEHGIEAPRRIVFIEEAACIGCTLCIQACPVDAIIGAPKRMHAVVEAQCTGCELCIPACPVDCIAFDAPSDVDPRATGWAAWSTALADAARARYASHRARLERDEREHAQRLAAKAAARQASASARAASSGRAPIVSTPLAGVVAHAASTVDADANVDTEVNTDVGTDVGTDVDIDANGADVSTTPDARATPVDAKRAAIEAALARARLRAKMRPS